MRRSFFTQVSKLKTGFRPRSEQLLKREDSIILGTEEIIAAWKHYSSLQPSAEPKRKRSISNISYSRQSCGRLHIGGSNKGNKKIEPGKDGIP